MLARVDPEQLDHVDFPLGAQTKDETRAEAARAGLAVASRGESQEACFLAGDDYRAFLERRGLARADGAIVDEQGRELGRHSGHWRFTPGQRKGLGISAPEPLYAVRSDASIFCLLLRPDNMTSWPSFIASARCLPRKPVPPVIRMRLRNCCNPIRF